VVPQLDEEYIKSVKAEKKKVTNVHSTFTTHKSLVKAGGGEDVPQPLYLSHRLPYVATERGPSHTR
jgi:hypothetical protein